MAIDIGTQAALLIDQTQSVVWALDGLGRIGTYLQPCDPADFYNLVEFLASLQAERFDALTQFLKVHVLSTASPIDVQVPA